MPIANFDLNAQQIAALQGGIKKVQDNMAKTGTVNGQTGDQNLANVYKGGMDPNKPVIPTQYIQGVLTRAAADDARANPPPVVPPETKVLDTNTGGGNNGGGNNGGGNSGVRALSNGNADLINQQYDQNYQSQLQKLREARQIQQQGLNMQETGVNQNALQNLNNNDAMATRQLKQLQEVQANNGVRGGDSITATIGNQTAQQQGANQINQDKMNQLTDIQQKRSLIDNNASSNDLALMQQLQAARSGQLIDNNNTQDQRALQLAMLMGKTVDGQQTLGGQQQALAQQQFGLQKDNQTFNQGQQGWQNKFNYGQATGQFDNGQTTMDKQKMDIAGQQFAQTMGLNYAQLSVQQQQVLGQLALGNRNAANSETQTANSYDLGLKNNQVANRNADTTLQTRLDNTNLDQQKIDWSKDPNNPFNQKNNALGAKYDAQTGQLLNSVSPVESTNNYNNAINQMESKTGLTKAQATTYAQSVQPHMSNADYKKLNDYIQKNY